MRKYFKKRLIEALKMVIVSGVVFGLSMLIAMLILVVTGCERRELSIYGSEFHSLTLNVDWHDYSDKNPDGMTAWFWPRETEDELVPDSLAEWGKPYRFTTSSVLHFDLYLHSGKYRGVVVDYSPEEFSKQEFLDMDDIQRARVVATLDAYQPTPDSLGQNSALYGPAAFGQPLPEKQNDNNYYVVRCQPEEMAIDTLNNMVVMAGEYGDYVPYNERTTYQEKLTVKEFRARPQSPIWELRLRLPVNGIVNIWQVEATLAGMADGHYLARGCNTDTPCLIKVDDWQLIKTNNYGSGYIETTVRTFGLRPGDRQENSVTRSRRGGLLVIEDASALRLNLMFRLRDRKTVCTYHYDLGKHVEEFADEQVLRLWMSETEIAQDPDVGGGNINLPYVEAYEGAGFGADVTPWEDGVQADVPM